MNKGQVEMMGLVIIIVLIIIGGLLFLRFGLTKQTPTKSSLETAQGYNLINAITNIKICENQSIRQAIHACNNQQTLCNQDACTYTQEQIGTILEETHQNKAFYAYNNEKEVIKINDCPYGTASPPYFFKEENKEYEITIKICK